MKKITALFPLVLAFFLGMSSAIAAPISETIDMIVSSTPSNILSAHTAYGPHSADVVIRGHYQEFPTLEFTATASLNSYLQPGWVVGPVTASGPLPTGVELPIIQTELFTSSPYFYLPTAYVWIKSGDYLSRASSWTVEGQATEQVGVVLLPRFQMLPWKGQKNLEHLKIRYTAPASPPNQTPPAVFDTVFNQFQASYAAMSNGKLGFTFTTRDHLTSLLNPYLTSSCNTLFAGMGGNDYNFRERIIQEIKAANPGYRRDAYLFTYDYSLSHGLTCDYFRSGAGTTHPPTVSCPDCGPAAELKTSIFQPIFPGAYGNALTSYFGHELGHGLGIQERYFNPINYCTDGGPQTVKPGHLFYKASNCQHNTEGLRDDSMGASGVRDGARYDLVDRAAFGWLSPSNVTTVTASGVYNLYQENNDLTVPNAPVILQIPVDYGGIQDYVYVSTINENTYNRYVTSTEPDVASYQANGVILRAGTASPSLVERYGSSKFAGHLTYYSYNNNQPNVGSKRSAIPVGASVNLTEFGSPVTIQVLSKSNGVAQVQVTIVPRSVTVAGRVTDPSGAGVRNAVVSVSMAGLPDLVATTSTFGYYSVANVPTGAPATVRVSSRRYRFAPVTMSFTGDVSNLDFVGQE